MARLQRAIYNFFDVFYYLFLFVGTVVLVYRFLLHSLSFLDISLHTESISFSFSLLNLSVYIFFSLSLFICCKYRFVICTQSIAIGWGLGAKKTLSFMDVCGFPE